MKCRKQYKQERGAYLTIMTMGSVLLLAFAGLALDGANMYLQKVALEKALDAGALAALAYRVEIGPGDAGRKENDIERRAREVARLNVEQNMSWVLRVASKDEHFRAGYNRGEETLFIDGEIFMNFLLMDKVLWGLKNTSYYPGHITARSRARIAPMNIALVLDTSNSMNCPGVGECHYAGLVASSDSKLARLQSAVKGFLSVFDPGPSRDHISLVPFDLVGSTQLGLASEADAIVLERTVDDLQALGTWTNPSDALLEAYRDNRNFQGPGTPWPTHYVLFTDGAPTAGRLLLADPIDDDTSLPESITEFSNYDFIHYGILNSLNLPLLGQSVQYWSPSPLIPTPGPGTPRQFFQHRGDRSSTALDAAVKPPPGAGLPPCSPYVTNRRELSQAVFPCLNPTRSTLGTHLPFADPRRGEQPRQRVPWESLEEVYNNYNKNQVFDVYNPSLYDKPNSRHDEKGLPIEKYNGDFSQVDPENFAHLYYNNAILYADFLRTTNGVVHTIGLGADSSSDPVVSQDPYQNVNNTWARKDYFLERVAASKECLRRSAGATGGREDFEKLLFKKDFHDEDALTLTTHPSGLARWQTLEAELADEQRGFCLLTSDPDDLAMMFRFLAQQLKLRLVEKF